MSFQFRPGVRENVGLLIGLTGPSGGGKTYTAMELATGISGGKRFAVVDTEARRALHYADQFKFDHGDLKPPFRPDNLVDAIEAADKAGYPAIVVDNASHIWYGTGGLLDWHDELLDEFVKRAQEKGNQDPEWLLRDKNNMRAWIKPKMSHKRMIQRLLQVRAHLIICLRAEEKTVIGYEDGKTKISNAGWQPICEKNLPYELTVSLLLTDDAPGMPEKAFKLQEQHRDLFPPNKQITRQTGEAIRQWAKGGEPAKLEDVLRDIGQADTLEQLQKVGAELATKRLAPDETLRARQAYKDQSEALKKRDAATTSPPDADSSGNGVSGDDQVSLCADMECGNPAIEGTAYCEVHP